MLTKIKVYACYTVKIYKNNLQFFKPGAHARQADPVSAFAHENFHPKLLLVFLLEKCIG